MAQKGKYPSLERQWRKLMYAFYDYLPMQYKNASARDWGLADKASRLGLQRRESL